jgi:hypothetical protein
MGPPSAAPFAAPFISPTAAPDTGFDGYPGAGTAYCAIAALDVPAARATTTAKTLNLVAIMTSLKHKKGGRAPPRELAFAEQEHNRDHAAHRQRDKHGDASFDPSPSPPIGFQVLHHILAVGSLASRELECLACEA